MSKTSFASDGFEHLYPYRRKKITLENWQTPDFPEMFSGITSKFWIEHVMHPTLSPNVPESVNELFEVARGSMVYGWLFYPVITLALEQQLRVMEAAAVEKCKRCGILADRPYAELLADLVKKRLINRADEKRWIQARELRNSRSHPRKPMVLQPGQALGNLETTCELINKLFA